MCVSDNLLTVNQQTKKSDGNHLFWVVNHNTLQLSKCNIMIYAAECGNNGEVGGCHTPVESALQDPGIESRCAYSKVL